MPSLSLRSWGRAQRIVFGVKARVSHGLIQKTYWEKPNLRASGLCSHTLKFSSCYNKYVLANGFHSCLNFVPRTVALGLTGDDAECASWCILRVTRCWHYPKRLYSSFSKYSWWWQGPSVLHTCSSAGDEFHTVLNRVSCYLCSCPPPNYHRVSAYIHCLPHNFFSFKSVLWQCSDVVDVCSRTWLGLSVLRL